MRSDTVIAPTLIVTTASNARVQVKTCPVQIYVDRDTVQAVIWAEKLISATRSASSDSARFAANLLDDLFA
jgi:hypothetical protein